MRRILVCFAVGVFLSGCAVFKIETRGFDTARLASLNPETSAIEPKKADFPEGMHCFEPMLFLLTLGIVPTHCINRYELIIQEDSGDKKSHEIVVTTMSGWIPLLFIPGHTWQYGKFNGSIVGLREYAN